MPAGDLPSVIDIPCGIAVAVGEPPTVSVLGPKTTNAAMQYRQLQPTLCNKGDRCLMLCCRSVARSVTASSRQTDLGGEVSGGSSSAVAGGQPSCEMPDAVWPAAWRLNDCVGGSHLAQYDKMLCQAQLRCSTPASDERSNWQASSRVAGRCGGSGGPAAGAAQQRWRWRKTHLQIDVQPKQAAVAGRGPTCQLLGLPDGCLGGAQQALAPAGGRRGHRQQLRRRAAGPARPLPGRLLDLLQRRGRAPLARRPARACQGTTELPEAACRR